MRHMRIVQVGLDGARVEGEGVDGRHSSRLVLRHRAVLDVGLTLHHLILHCHVLLIVEVYSRWWSFSRSVKT